MPDTTHKLLLTPKEACHQLGISRSYLFELLASGQVPSVRLGRLRRIPAAALEAWIARQLAAAVSEPEA